MQVAQFLDSQAWTICFYFIFFIPFYFWQTHPFTPLDSVTAGGELVIVSKAKKGVTKLMRNYTSRNNGNAMMRIAIEGLSGTRSSLHYFDNVLLLTSGTGLPGPCLTLLNLANINCT